MDSRQIKQIIAVIGRAGAITFALTLMMSSGAVAQDRWDPAHDWNPGYGINPGFDRCRAEAKHADVPEIKHMIYDRARKKLIAAGWRPWIRVETPDQLRDLTMYGGNAQIFWSRGYSEVDHCLPTGNASCRFNFVDRHGNRLHLQTTGEEHKSFHAAVSYAQLLCPDS